MRDIGSIYFAQAEASGLVKIGFALDVRDRIYSLAVGSPVRVELLGALPALRAAEKALHRALRPKRIKGEWYSAEFAMGVYDDLAELFERSGLALTEAVILDEADALLSEGFAPIEALDRGDLTLA